MSSARHKIFVTLVTLCGLALAACGSSSDGADANDSGQGSSVEQTQDSSADQPADAGQPDDTSKDTSEGSPKSENVVPNWDADLLAAAPVADPADIPKDTVLWKAHERGKLINAGTHSLQFFQLEDPTSGTVEGFGATLTRLLAKYITGEPNVEIVNATSETRPSLVNNGTADVSLLAYSITAERTKNVDFAGPYFSSQHVVTVAPDDDSIHSLDDLDGKTVCTTQGSTAYVTVEDMVPGAEHLLLDAVKECFLAVQQGRADAAVTDETSAYASITKGDVKIAVSDFQKPDHWGIGLAKDSPEAVKFINDWLDQIIGDGTWQEVWENTVGIVPGTEPIVPAPGNFDFLDAG